MSIMPPRLGWSLAVLAASCLLGATTGWSQPAPPTVQGNLAPTSAEAPGEQAIETLNYVRRIVEHSAASVVHIEAKKADEANNKALAYVEEAGAGVIIELKQRYFVLTNRHVVLNAAVDDIHVQLKDGRFFRPTEIRADRDSDLALLYLAESNLSPARLGDSDSVQIGDYALAIGSPFGLNHSVTSGIISGKGRRDLQLGNNGVRYQDFLQTDAAINPGNSGGPLINARGEVIGINTAIASNSGGSDGIGFTIPINAALRVARELVEFGYVRRGFLGVSLDARYNRDAAQALGLNTAFGARVSGITPDSPASQTDLLVGDVILTFAGRVVENDSHLVSQVSLTPVGTTVALEVFRNGKRTTVQAVIHDRENYQVSK